MTEDRFFPGIKPFKWQELNGKHLVIQTVLEKVEDSEVDAAYLFVFGHCGDIKYLLHTEELRNDRVDESGD